MKEDFALGDLKKTLELKQKHLCRLQRNKQRLDETIARAESDIASLEAAIKKAGKKEDKK